MRLEDYLRAGARRLIASDTPHLDIRLLAKEALSLTDAEIILSADRRMSEYELNRLDALLARRLKGESVAHIIGEKEFYGLNFKLAPGVLAPRSDTETLVEAAARRRAAGAALSILDLGVGSGALLCALLTIFPNARGVGVDVSGVAAACAAGNARRLGLGRRAQVLCGDWTSALAATFDMIVSNPPYIADSVRDDLATEIRDFEDPRALFAGPDGLGAFDRIFDLAPPLLHLQGMMILEFGAGQSAALVSRARAAFPKAGLSLENDLAGRPRALIIDFEDQKNH